jgi:acetate kinase
VNARRPRVLVVNVGSSTVKLDVLHGSDRQDGTVLAASVDPAAVEAFIRSAGPLDAVGHRVVHGGPGRTGPALVTDELLAELDEVSVLAPLHNPPALAMIRTVRALRPDLPAVACFDTMFHATIPIEAATYALPAEWRERWGVKVYGFHGLSHAYASRRAAEMLGRPVERLRIVTCHLGAGASLAAVYHGRSVATTMGFTPLAGLPMATRSGDVDPGALLWLQEQTGMGPAEMNDSLMHRSGLAGLSGGTGDMRQVLTRMTEGDPASTLAWRVYNHRLRQGISAMVGEMGGLDALVFTGGIGERSGLVRLSTCVWAGYLGVDLDLGANAALDAEGDELADVDLSEPGAAVRTLVVRAREDLEIASLVAEVLVPVG